MLSNPGKERGLIDDVFTQFLEHFSDLVIGLVEIVSVYVQKGQHGGSGGSLVAVDEGLSLGNEESVCSRLVGDSYVGILTEGALLRLADCSCELMRRSNTVEPTVIDERTTMKRLDLIEGEIDHGIGLVGRGGLLSETLQQTLPRSENTVRCAFELLIRRMTVCSDHERIPLDTNLDFRFGT